jgi:ABC-type amino acid transport substrate-binding protein
VSFLGNCHRSVIRKSVDGGIGSQKNGTWDGIIGMLVRGQVEVGVSSFLITTKRMEVVDFTHSLAEAG